MRRDSGVATVWTACAVAGLVFLGTFLIWLGAAAGARHRAESAADLAALAAAGEVRLGVDAACARARWVTDRMKVGLVSCRVAQWDAFVEVQAVLPGVLARFGSTGARARAGPVHRSP
ncbi:Rv3654c family TadE-like protein [Amycolatopsis sp.]|uniref:Rv3654c family TadE-like protein n=1 Tax=Amycolatopsis sp. TaxID=37632 RepID=UPI002DFE3EF6|nr:Rv3654c family TadE-like protein [Amycolatopsis sp.]